jgi:hypothetical protein
MNTCTLRSASLVKELSHVKMDPILLAVKQAISIEQQQ